MEGWGKAGSDGGYHVFPLHRTGAVGDGWAHKSRAPQRWQCLCHSSTPTSQLQSSDWVCEHISGEILPPSAWKHNHTHACAFATLQNRLRLTFIWLCIFISCTHAGVLMDMEEFLEAKLLFPPSIFPVHWRCEWVHGKREALELSMRRYPVILHLQMSSLIPFMHPLFVI